MANENALLEMSEIDNEDSFDFDELESKLQSDLDSQLSDLDFLHEDREKIGSPENLGATVMNVVWEQFLIQMAATAGEDFIKDNQKLTLDLRDEAHIQTTENFKKGKIATHNYKSKEQLEQNYDRYKNKPHGNYRIRYVNPGMNNILKRAGKLKSEGVDTVTDIYNGRQIPTKTKLENGENDPQAAQREHVKSSAELYTNPSLQMANTDAGLADIINNPENLQGYTTAERNKRKSDNSANEMNEKDKNKHWEKANERAEEYINQKEKDGEERLKKEGRESQKEEAFKIGGKALRTAIMMLLAELVKEVIRKLILWFKSTQKNLESLLESIKSAISSFVSKLKAHFVNAGSGIATTIATTIFRTIANIIKKVWVILKQGWKSFKEVIAYLKNPESRNKPFSVLLLEVGKIVMAGLTAISAIVLSEIIERSLSTIPGVGAIFAIEIPLIGSLGNLLGIFLGGLVAGVIGAIALNLIDRLIAKKLKAEAIKKEIGKGNEILNTQDALISVAEIKLDRVKNDATGTITERHHMAGTIIKDVLENVFNDNYKNETACGNNENDFDDMLEKLNELTV